MKAAILTTVISIFFVSHAHAGPCHDAFEQVEEFYADVLDDDEMVKLKGCMGVNKVCMVTDDGNITSANHVYKLSNPDSIVKAGIMQHGNKQQPACVMAQYSPGRGAEWKFKAVDTAPFGGDITAVEGTRLNSDVVSASDLVSKFREITKRFLKN